MKKCSKCNKTKSADYFYKSKRTKTGLRSRCKACEAEDRKEYMRQYYVDNKDKLLEWYHKRRETGLGYDMMGRTKYRAKKRGLDFNLTIGDFVIPSVCPVLGIPIKINEGRKGGSHNSPSIDRINPNLGYVKGNVRIISNRANTLKCNASVGELELVIKNLRTLKGM